MIIPTSTLSSNFFNNIFKGNSNSKSISNINSNSQGSMYTSVWVDSPTPLWSDLDSILLSTEPREERSSFNLMTEGRGPANHKANIRYSHHYYKQCYYHHHHRHHHHHQIV